MSGFDEIFKDFENDVRISSHIPPQHRGRVVEAAAATAGLRAALHSISGIFFDDHSSTWRDGQGNIVPPPSERGDSNRVFSRGMMLETASGRPEYKRAERRWVDKHPQFPLDSSDPAVVEKHLRDVYESNNVPISAEDARAIREVYERAAGGPKLPHYGGKETAIARKALEKLRKPAALPPDAGSDLSSSSSSPPVLVDNKERDRPALDERPQRDQPYAGDEIAAPLGDEDDVLEQVFSQRDAGEAPVTRFGVTRRNGEYFMSYQGREFAIPASDPQEYNKHWQKELAGYTGDDLAFRSAKMRGMSHLFYIHGSQYIRDKSRDRNFSEARYAEALHEATLAFGKPLEVVEAERRARFSGEAPVSAPAPKRPVSEIASEIFDSYRAKRPAPAAPNAPDAAARPSSRPPAPPAAEVDMQEPFVLKDPTAPIEIEVNDAPGAPYQPPSYFDVDAPRQFGAAAPGIEYQSSIALLHEDQIERSRKRRYHTRVLAPEAAEVRYFSPHFLLHGSYGWESSYEHISALNIWGVPDIQRRIRCSVIWTASSTKSLVPSTIAFAGDAVTFTVAKPTDAYGFLSGGLQLSAAYQQNFLTYVPQGLGVSERFGLQVVGNYLQFRCVVSPGRFVPRMLRGGTGSFLPDAYPYSSDAIQYTTTDDDMSRLPSTTQSLHTVHRVIVVLTTNPFITFSDVVVDGLDIHAPVSLHTRGALEVLKDVYVQGSDDRDVNINVQLGDRVFHYSPLSAIRENTNAPTPAAIREVGMTRGYHVVALYAASIVSYALDLVDVDLGPGKTYESQIRKFTIPPRCHMSYSFSYSDA